MILDSSTPDTRDRSLAARLRSQDPDVSAMMDLYDSVAAVVWAYARHRTRNRTQARKAVIDAFTAAAEAPRPFGGRLSRTAQLLLVLHVQTERPKPALVRRLRMH
jgi:hypothetical protein